MVEKSAAAANKHRMVHVCMVEPFIKNPFFSTLNVATKNNDKLKMSLCTRRRRENVDIGNSGSNSSKQKQQQQLHSQQRERERKGKK